MTGTVHIRRTIVVEYDVNREDYTPGSTEAGIRKTESELAPAEIWPDLSPEIVISHTTEVTFR